jgi:hypothetical protein
VRSPILLSAAIAGLVRPAVAHAGGESPDDSFSGDGMLIIEELSPLPETRTAGSLSRQRPVAMEAWNDPTPRDGGKSFQDVATDFENGDC